jgi:hypothetical protein
MLGGGQSMRWYVNQSGKTVGPFTEERIAMLVTWGKIARDAYICDEQFSSWVSITRTAFGPLVTNAAHAGGEERPPRSAPAGQKLRAWLAGVMLFASAVMLAISAT